MQNIPDNDANATLENIQRIAAHNPQLEVDAAIYAGKKQARIKTEEQLEKSLEIQPKIINNSKYDVSLMFIKLDNPFSKKVYSITAPAGKEIKKNTFLEGRYVVGMQAITYPTDSFHSDPLTPNNQQPTKKILSHPVKIYTTFKKVTELNKGTKKYTTKTQSDSFTININQTFNWP